MKHTGIRDTIRQFLKGVEWCNASNIALLIRGTNESKAFNWADFELYEMAASKNPEKRVKILPNPDHHIFADIQSKKRDKGNHQLDHDLKLRDVLAKYLYLRNYEGIEQLSVKRIKNNPDGHIGNLYFELDSGHEDDAQLKEKLERYSGPGKYQVFFIMAHRYGSQALEASRAAKLMELGRAKLRHKPNRILVSSYSHFIAGGHPYNLKGDSFTF